MTRVPKRPRDLNQWAKRMVDIATGEASDREPTPEEQGKDPAAVARGKLGGAIGGTRGRPASLRNSVGSRLRRQFGLAGIVSNRKDRGDRPFAVFRL